MVSNVFLHVIAFQPLAIFQNMALMHMEDDFTAVRGGAQQPSLKPGRRRKRGSLGDLLSKSHLPPGPDSLKELFNYPVNLVADAFKVSERKDRCLSLLRDGVAEHSDYSGISAEREAKRLLFQVLEEDYDLSVPHEVTKACDIDPDCQDVLIQASDILDNGRSCVFTDIRCQVHPEVQAFCEDALVKADGSQEGQQAVYQKIWDHLLLPETGALAVHEDRFRLNVECCLEC